MLPAKLHSADAIAQPRPEKRFAAGERSAEFAGADERLRRDAGHGGRSLISPRGMLSSSYLLLVAGV
jgi:hypothetical protein